MFHSEETDVEESWTTGIETTKLLERTKEFHPSIRAVMGKAKDVKQWPMLFRPPIERWHRDRVVLVGDAAHPMLPRKLS
jgi:salicylate hydroxylase